MVAAKTFLLISFLYSLFFGFFLAFLKFQNKNVSLCGTGL